MWTGGPHGLPCPPIDRQKRERRGRAAKQKGETSMKQQIAAAALAASLGSSYATAQEMRRVVTGLDERNHSVVLFDSKMPLKQVVPGIIATNFWITDTYPPSLLKDDPPAGRSAPHRPTTGPSFGSWSFCRSMPRPKPRCRPKCCRKASPMHRRAAFR